MEIIDLKKIEKINSIFQQSGCAQLSDASNTIEDKNGFFQLHEISAVDKSKKLCGPIYSVNTDNDMLPCLQVLSSVPVGYVIFINNINEISEALAGDIYVSDCIQSGCSGLVVRGAIRDTNEIKKMKFPVFTKEVNFVSARTAQIKATTVPQIIKLEDKLIEPNDWFFGDEDGVFIVKEKYLTALLYGVQIVEEMEVKLKNELNKGNRLHNLCGLSEYISGRGKLKFNI